MARLSGPTPGFGTIDTLGVERSTPSTRGSVSEPTPSAQGSFGEALEKAVGEVSAALDGADKATADALTGRGEAHTAMIAMTQADLTFRFAMQVRNKALDAYREMMNLPV
jgi:flagellar hook-basal body complex protein FliE